MTGGVADLDQDHVTGGVADLDQDHVTEGVDPGVDPMTGGVADPGVDHVTEGVAGPEAGHMTGGVTDPDPGVDHMTGGVADLDQGHMTEGVAGPGVAQDREIEIGGDQGVETGEVEGHDQTVDHVITQHDTHEQPAKRDTSKSPGWLLVRNLHLHLMQVTGRRQTDQWWKAKVGYSYFHWILAWSPCCSKREVQ